MQEHGWLAERELLIAVAVGMISPEPVVIRPKRSGGAVSLESQQSAIDGRRRWNWVDRFPIAPSDLGDGALRPSFDILS